MDQSRDADIAISKPDLRAKIRNLAIDIEAEISLTVNDTGDIYRSKCQSLISNIKDQNKGLFEKIFTGEITVQELVQCFCHRQKKKDDTYDHIRVILLCQISDFVC